MNPDEKQLMWMKRLNHLYFKSPESKKKYFEEEPTADYFWTFGYHGQPPIGVHMTMFAHSLNTFSNDEQRA